MATEQSIHERHEGYAHQYAATGDGDDRARIAAMAREHFKARAQGLDPFCRAAVYYQFWATVARRASYAAKGA